MCLSDLTLWYCNVHVCLCVCPQLPAQLSALLLADLESLVSQCDSAYRHAPVTDTIVYTGTAGVALLHLHLATTLYAKDEGKRSTHLHQAHSLITPSLQHLRTRDRTFLCGAAGLIAIAAVLEAALGRMAQARVSCGVLKNGLFLWLQYM